MDFFRIVRSLNKKIPQSFLLGIAASFGIVVFFGGIAAAQSYDPTHSRHFEFTEDQSKPKKAIEDKKKAALKVDKANKKVIDVKAPNLTFEKDQKTLDASGGMLLSGGGVEAQADHGKFNTETKDAYLEGNVIFNGSSAEINADSAAVNLEDETG